MCLFQSQFKSSYFFFFLKFVRDSFCLKILVLLSSSFVRLSCLNGNQCLSFVVVFSGLFLSAKLPAFAVLSSAIAED